MSGAGPSLSLRIRALLLNAVCVSFRFSTVFRGFEIFNIYHSKSSDQVVFTERSAVGLFKPGTGLPAWVVRSFHGLILLIELQSYVTAFHWAGGVYENVVALSVYFFQSHNNLTLSRYIF